MRITEIFTGIQGESSAAGFLTAFVRCTGCNLDCTYCDTRYAREGGRTQSVSAIIAEVAASKAARVTVTGGEPLHQPDTPALCARLLADGRTVQVETNGSLDIGLLPEGTRVIMDIKTPGSGMSKANDPSNLDRLKPGDELKFVLCGRSDYEWACRFLNEHPLPAGNEVLFSAAWSTLAPTTLAEWMIADRINRARLQVQLHKILWPGDVRR